MRALILDPPTVAAIQAAIEQARANPKSRELLAAAATPLPEEQLDVLKLEDRPQGVDYDKLRGVPVDIPIGYRANFSFEEQPVGLCRHLSISVERAGMLPNVAAVMMIAKEYGIDFDPATPLKEGTWWLEEFAPGHQALNILVKEPADEQV